MNPKLRTLLLQGAKQAGSFEPEMVVGLVEEQLTPDETKTANAFLEWIMRKNLTFGYGNIDFRFNQFQKESGNYEGHQTQ